eukprot:scaffold4944_cov125-Skeletonema_marinoi.AAC.1
MMNFQQLIVAALLLDFSTASAVETAVDSTHDGAASSATVPVRKRTHLRHLSSEEQNEIYDPFIGIPRELQADRLMRPRKLRADRVMSMPSASAMSIEQAAPSYTSSCPLDCGEEICAFSSPDSEPFCYPKCLPSFPVFSAGDGECRAGDVCIHSTFACGSYNDVMNEFCECNAFNDTTGTFRCWASECSVDVVTSAKLS